MQGVEKLIIDLVVSATPAQLLGGIVASILGLLAAWYGNKILLKWTQAYRSRQQVAEQARLKEIAEALVRKAQSESDKLKELEGR